METVKRDWDMQPRSVGVSASISSISIQSGLRTCDLLLGAVLAPQTHAILSGLLHTGMLMQLHDTRAKVLPALGDLRVVDPVVVAEGLGSRVPGTVAQTAVLRVPPHAVLEAVMGSAHGGIEGGQQRLVDEAEVPVHRRLVIFGRVGDGQRVGFAWGRTLVQFAGVLIGIERHGEEL